MDEAVKSKIEDQNLKKKYDDLQKDYEEKLVTVKGLESRIPKMIEEFTKYVEEKDSLHSKKENEFSKALQEKENEIKRATGINQLANRKGLDLEIKHKELQ